MATPHTHCAGAALVLAAWCLACTSDPSAPTWDASEDTGGIPDAGDDPVADAGPDGDAGAWPHGPVDLARFARLSATDPALQPLMPWPREADDAIATVRDDWDGTSYKAPAGQSVVVVDLLPWLGTPVPLGEVRLHLPEGLPDKASLSLLPACPLSPAPAGSTPWPDPSVPMPLAGTAAGCLVLAFDSHAPFQVAGLELLSHAPGIQPPQIPDAPPAAGIRHPLSGVVEGFYGVPWSWRERSNMVAHIAHLGMGTYLYAPKDDPRHRHEWRTPYEPEDMLRFAELAALGASLGVHVLVGMSPFVDWGPDAEADYATLLAKLLAFREAGVRGFVLLADDIEFDVEQPVDSAMAAAQVDIANRLLDDLNPPMGPDDDGTGGSSGRLPDMLLWFVPTVYSDEREDRFPGGAEYLEALSALDPDIRLMWTGPGTSNATLAASDFDHVTGLTGRRPIVWENYWANDGGDGFTGRLPLAPYAGRDASLPAALEGIVANPMIQGALSRLPVGSLARYLDDPKAYGPAGQPLLSAAAEAPFLYGTTAAAAGAEDLLALVQQLFDADTLGLPGWPEMEQAIDALEAGLEQPDNVPASEAAALLRLFARGMVLADAVRRSSLDADMDDELVYPLRKVGLDSRAGIHALQALSQKLAGGDPSESFALAKEAQAQSLACRFVFSKGEVDGLLSAVDALPVADRGVVPVLPGDPFPPCTAGAKLTWKPFAGCDAPEVFGMPGATAQGPVVSWVPEAPGVYTIAAICAGTAGWGASTATFACMLP